MKSDKFIHAKRWILIGVGITVVVALILVAFFGLRPKSPTDSPQDTGQTTTATGIESPDGTTTAPDTPTKPSESQPGTTQGGEEENQGGEDPGGTTAPTTKPPQGGSVEQGGTTNPNDPASQGVKVERIATYSGKFVEDGSNRPVENVPALLVTNITDKFLDIANITYDLDGKTATFIVTGLPAGGSAWVLEYQGMTMTKENSLRYVGCVPSFRENVKESATEVTLKVAGNHIQATNTTDDTLYNVFVYYKNLHTDGNYLGGIAYMVKFDKIDPGQTVETLAGHYVDGKTRIVRVGWQEGQTDNGS